MTPEEVAAVKAAHVVAPRGLYNCATCLVHWPCEPYRLAEALAASEAKVARLWSTWEPYDEDDEGAVPWRLQRDMRAALADQPEPAANFRRSADA